MFRLNRLFTVLLLVALLVSACQPIVAPENLPSRPPTAEAVTQAFAAAWSEGDVDALDAIVSPDVVVHDPPAPAQQGLDAYKADVVEARVGVPDAKLTFIEAVMVGDEIYTRWTYGGTHTGDSADLGPATGRAFLMTGNTVARFEDGLLVELWHGADDLGMMLQLGMQLGPPEQPQAEPSPLRHVQGEILLPGVPEWGGVTISMRVDFSEVNPETHEATGFINWRNFQPQPPAGEPYWKVVDSEVRYVFFGADAENGDPNTVVVITQIKSKEGWGQGEPGEYGYFWFRDGGKEGTDQWGNRSYTMDPWQEFFPADKPPVDTGYFTLEMMQTEVPVLPLTVETGDLTIQ